MFEDGDNKRVEERPVSRKPATIINQSRCLRKMAALVICAPIRPGMRCTQQITSSPISLAACLLSFSI